MISNSKNLQKLLWRKIFRDFFHLHRIPRRFRSEDIIRGDDKRQISPEYLKFYYDTRDVRRADSKSVPRRKSSNVDEAQERRPLTKNPLPFKSENQNKRVHAYVDAAASAMQICAASASRPSRNWVIRNFAIPHEPIRKITK